MDRSFLDTTTGKSSAAVQDALNARAAYDRIERLTVTYNKLGGGKREGRCPPNHAGGTSSTHPTKHHPRLSRKQLPAAWQADASPTTSNAKLPYASTKFRERSGTVSMNAAHFTRKHDANGGTWHILQDLGISGGSVVFGYPGHEAAAGWINEAAATGTMPFDRSSHEPWLEYDFSVLTKGYATLTMHLLPTFPLDSSYLLRYAVALDGAPPAPARREWIRGRTEGAFILEYKCSS